MPLQPGSRLGPYEIVALIGAGGMGEVYRARDTRLDRTVAIKVLPAEVAGDPDSRARFQAPSRHYHRHRVEDPQESWDQWIGNQRRGRKSYRGLAKGIAWALGALGFGGLIALMYYQMR